MYHLLKATSKWLNWSLLQRRRKIRLDYTIHFTQCYHNIFRPKLKFIKINRRHLHIDFKVEREKLVKSSSSRSIASRVCIPIHHATWAGESWTETWEIVSNGRRHADANQAFNNTFFVINTFSNNNAKGNGPRHGIIRRFLSSQP